MNFVWLGRHNKALLCVVWGDSVNWGSWSAKVSQHILCPKPQMWFTQETQEWISISAAWVSVWADTSGIGGASFFQMTGKGKKNLKKKESGKL